MAELSTTTLDLTDEDIGLDSEEPIRIVICMMKEQSRRLAQAKFVQSDIAFKRVVGFKEFELGGMDPENKTGEVLILSLHSS